MKKFIAIFAEDDCSQWDDFDDMMNHLSGGDVAGEANLPADMIAGILLDTEAGKSEYINQHRLQEWAEEYARSVEEELEHRRLESFPSVFV